MLFHGCESMLGRANCIKMQMPDPGNGSDTSVLLDLLSMSTVVNIEQINVKPLENQHCKQISTALNTFFKFSHRQYYLKSVVYMLS